MIDKIGYGKNLRCIEIRWQSGIKQIVDKLDVVKFHLILLWFADLKIKYHLRLFEYLYNIWNMQFFCVKILKTESFNEMFFIMSYFAVIFGCGNDSEVSFIQSVKEIYAD